MSKRAPSSLSGFTVIETMLFLAVSGALLAGIIFATGTSINTQRYRDATESFKALLQKQYSEVDNVQNSEPANRSCNTQAMVTPGSTVRGQGNCIVAGKFITIHTGAVTTYQVLAYEVSPPTSGVNDITALQSNYRLNIVKTAVETTTLEWDSQIAWATAGNTADHKTSGARSIGILIVRSPVSGKTYTFTSNSVPTTAQIQATTSAPSYLSAMIQPGTVVPGQAARTICLSSGGLTTTPRNAIYIAPYASGASSIEVRSNDTSAKLGAAERC